DAERPLPAICLRYVLPARWQRSIRPCVDAGVEINEVVRRVTSLTVESKMGAVAGGLWPSPRFPSPLIEPEVPISGARLSDWLHRKAHDAAARGRRSRRSRPSSP